MGYGSNKKSAPIQIDNSEIKKTINILTRKADLSLSDFNVQSGDDATQAFKDAMAYCGQFERALKIPNGSFITTEPIINRARRLYGVGAFIDSGTKGSLVNFRPKAGYSDLDSAIVVDGGVDIILENFAISSNIKSYGVRELAEGIDKTLFEQRHYNMFKQGVVGITIDNKATAILRAVKTGNLKFGVRLNNQVGHVTFYDTKLGGWVAGLYVDRNNQDYFVQGGSIQGNFASILLGTSGVNIAMKRVHLGFSPYGFYQVYDDKTYGMKGFDSCIMDDVRFEKIGECAIDLIYSVWDSTINGFGLSWSSFNTEDSWYTALPVELKEKRQQYAMRVEGWLWGNDFKDDQYGGLFKSPNIEDGKVAYLGRLNGPNDLTALGDLSETEIGSKALEAPTNKSLNSVYENVISPSRNPIRGKGYVPTGTIHTFGTDFEIVTDLSTLPVPLPQSIKDEYGSELLVFKITPRSTTLETDQASVEFMFPQSIRDKVLTETINMRYYLLAENEVSQTLLTKIDGQTKNYYSGYKKSGNKWVSFRGIEQKIENTSLNSIKIASNKPRLQTYYVTMPFIVVGDDGPYAPREHLSVLDTLEIIGADKGIILTSKNGVRYKLSVAEDGTLITSRL